MVIIMRSVIRGRLCFLSMLAMLTSCSVSMPGDTLVKPKLMADYSIDMGNVSLAQNSRVRFLAFHYTALDLEESIEKLTRQDVSAHYLVPGRPSKYQNRLVSYQLVDEQKRAWHAGVSQWKGRSNLNDTSIGIEIVNSGWDEVSGRLIGDPYTEEQTQLLINLARDVVARYGIAPTDVVGHSDIAPQRKIDPGPFFPWERLAQAGVGTWPDNVTKEHYQSHFEMLPPTKQQVTAAFERYGYYYFDSDESAVTRAFQMRFRPTRISGEADIETVAILFALIEKYYGAEAVELLLKVA